MPKVALTKPVLVIAPHLVYPTRNGADVLADRTARELSRRVPYVDVVGSEVVVRYEAGLESSRHAYAGGMRSKEMATLRTVALRSHYYQEKFLTQPFRNKVAELIQSTDFGLVVCSYIVSINALPSSNLAPPSNGSQRSNGSPPSNESRPVVVSLTHNDEFSWFHDLERKTSNLLGKWAARQSIRWLKTFLYGSEQNVYFAHVSQQDKTGFQDWISPHKSMVMPIGADIPDEPVPARLPQSRHSSVIFVGSLSVGMNFDALVHFYSVFYPRLSAELDLKVIIAGSNPSDRVKALCLKAGWDLHPNVSDTVLRSLYEQSDAAMLPFEYSNGSKLKLLAALSQGVPVLTTTAIHPPTELQSEFSIHSDNPEKWVEALRAIDVRGISPELRHSIRETTLSHSWQCSVNRLLAELDEID